MLRSVFFNIADHILLVKAPSNFPLMNSLPSFIDFVINDTRVDPLIEVNIVYDIAPDFLGESKVLSENSDVWGEGFRFEETDSYYITSMNNETTNANISMVSSKEFKKSTIYLADSDTTQQTLISWFLMVAFGQSVLPYQTVLIHASVVEREQNEAYGFLGKSGTGKSTHSQLWINYLDGFSLLNDDNPAIRIFNGNEAFIYGTPWSGKTKCYRDLKIRLKGLVRLQQAEVNQFQIKKNMQSLLMILPSCSAIRWNRKLFNNMVDTISTLINIVPVGTMDCLINEDAANICYNGITVKTKIYE